MFTRAACRTCRKRQVCLANACPTIQLLLRIDSQGCLVRYIVSLLVDHWYACHLSSLSLNSSCSLLDLSPGETIFPCSKRLGGSSSRGPWPNWKMHAKILVNNKTGAFKHINTASNIWKWQEFCSVSLYFHRLERVKNSDLPHLGRPIFYNGKVTGPCVVLYLLGIRLGARHAQAPSNPCVSK